VVCGGAGRRRQRPGGLNQIYGWPAAGRENERNRPAANLIRGHSEYPAATQIDCGRLAQRSLPARSCRTTVQGKHKIDQDSFAQKARYHRRARPKVDFGGGQAALKGGAPMPTIPRSKLAGQAFQNYWPHGKTPTAALLATNFFVFEKTKLTGGPGRVLSCLSRLPLVVVTAACGERNKVAFSMGEPGPPKAPRSGQQRTSNKKDQKSNWSAALWGRARGHHNRWWRATNGLWTSLAEFVDACHRFESGREYRYEAALRSYRQGVGHPILPILPTWNEKRGVVPRGGGATRKVWKLRAANGGPHGQGGRPFLGALSMGRIEGAKPKPYKGRRRVAAKRLRLLPIPSPQGRLHIVSCKRWLP